MRQFNYNEVKDIQETWKRSHNRENSIETLMDKYLCQREDIERVLDGDKNISTYAGIKSVRGKAITIKKISTKELKKITEDVVKEETSKKETVEEKPKKKGGWPKGKPRKKVEIKGEVSQETFDALMKPDMCTLTRHPITESYKKLVDKVATVSKTTVIEEPVELDVPKIYKNVHVTVPNNEEFIEKYKDELVDGTETTPTMLEFISYNSDKKDVTLNITMREVDITIDALAERKRYLLKEVDKYNKLIDGLQSSIENIEGIITELSKASNRE